MKQQPPKTTKDKLATVLRNAKGIITSESVLEKLNIGREEANKLLSRWHTAGWIMRIKRGVYVPIPIDADSSSYGIDDPWVAAHRLYNPGYISGLTAVDYWDFSEQIFETVFYSTTKQLHQRNIDLGNISLRLKTIKQERLFGLKEVWRDNNKVPVSDPTKTIVDLFDDPKLAGGGRNMVEFYDQYLESKYADVPLLFDYAKKMENKTIFKRLGLANEILEVLPDETKKIATMISKGVSDFDPTVKSTNIITRWGLRVGRAWKAEYDRKK